MSDAAADLVTALLASDLSQRERLVRSAIGPEIELAVQVLGRRRETAAGEVLSLIEAVVDDRALKKAARRELHRLRSMGIQVAERVVSAAEPAPLPSVVPLSVSQAWATDIDSSGSRALWVLGERPLGGAWFSALLLNDTRGLLEMSLVDTTRKRFARELEDSRSGEGTWVDLPGGYAMQLVREAADLTREADGALPTQYKAFRDVFGEAPSAPERALVYETISPVEASFNPNWLDESPQLLGEPEVGGWHIPAPADLQARALDVARLPLAALMVPGHSPEQEALQLVADAGQRTLTPLLRRAIRRRLEETGYLFVVTERLLAARLAVAAARSVEDSRLSADRHPLLKLLVAAGLARLLGSEMVGRRRAAEALLELVERASQERERTQSAAGIETRPSGLILPR